MPNAGGHDFGRRWFFHFQRVLVLLYRCRTGGGLPRVL